MKIVVIIFCGEGIVMQKKLNKMYLIISLITLFNASCIFSGFGKGFGAGVGTFLGVSMLSNAIAQSNQPRVVYVNPAQQRPPVYNEDLAQAQFNNRTMLEEQARMNYLEHENQRKALAIQEEKLRLKERELALKEAQLKNN